MANRLREVISRVGNIIQPARRHSDQTRSGRVVLSTRAYADVLNETSQHLDTETGGVLIGRYQDGTWYVVESIDPGPRAMLSLSYFEYDQGYVTHLANKVRLRYVAHLELVGLWHRHPGSFDRFSSTDDETHLRYLRQCGGPVVSILVNIDPELRLTSYAIDGPSISHYPIPYLVGDKHFPPGLLEPIGAAALLNRIHGSARCKIEQKVEVAGRYVDDTESAFAPRQPVSVPALSQQNTELVDVLDSEMDFLESQHDFSYQLQMIELGLLLTMRHLRDQSKRPLQFLFEKSQGRLTVRFDQHLHDFREGIVEQLVGERFY